MTSLKKSGLLRTYYRDRLRGYRLGAKAKAALLDGWPERFSPYLTGDTDTNRLKSEVNRRLRLHRRGDRDRCRQRRHQDERRHRHAVRVHPPGR